VTGPDRVVSDSARQLDRGGPATKQRDKLGMQLLTLLIFRIILSHFCVYNFFLSFAVLFCILGVLE